MLDNTYELPDQPKGSKFTIDDNIVNVRRHSFIEEPKGEVGISVSPDNILASQGPISVCLCDGCSRSIVAAHKSRQLGPCRTISVSCRCSPRTESRGGLHHLREI